MGVTATSAKPSRLILSAFEFSYCLLTADQQRMFRYLGISPCSDITLEAAAAMTGLSPDAAANGLRRGSLSTICWTRRREATSGSTTSSAPTRPPVACKMIRHQIGDAPSDC